MDLKSKIILIYGPTASGKSDFAIKLAKKINGEIINADSMQIYKEFKILSARPFKKDYQKIKHHLYGSQSVRKIFSTGHWLNQKVLDIKKRKKTPIFVGGTGLYFKALTDGLVDIPNIPTKFRYQVRFLHSKLGSKKFFLELTKIDPSAKKLINPLDSQRAIRAYEIKLFTKRSMHDFFKKTKSKYQQEDFYKIFIDFPRDKLVKKIETRSKEMIKKGLILEVKKFIRLKVSKKMTASKAIGVNEVRDYLDKKITISDLIEKISIKTRQYAKRQMTWGRGHMKNWNKLESNSLNRFIKKI